MRQVLYFDPSGQVQENLPASELRTVVKKGKGLVWIDLMGESEEDWKLVESLFDFHPLALEDCRGRTQRPKVEEYPGHLLLVCHALNFNEQSHVLDTIELDALLANNLLVTTHDERLRSVTETLERCRKNPDVMDRGADYLLYSIVDRIVDYYFPILDEFEDEIDAFETRIFESFDQSVYADIFDAKKRLLSLRRFMIPQRETWNMLAFRPFPGIRTQTQIFFRDVYDHAVRQHDSIEVLRDLISGALDSYLSQVSNRMNEIMKVLTIVGTIMLPLGFLTGVFGMNFVSMPGLENPNGFWYLVAGMVVLSGSMLLFFKHRDWI